MNTYPYPQSNTQRFLKIAGYILGLAVLIGLLLFSGPFIQKNILHIGSSGGVESSRDSYQAVFLANNQVYFGKLTSTSGDYLTLTDIYYLQVGGSQPGSIQGTGQSPNDKIFLVKLGNELHGPTDEMHIAKNQVLFYETLKKDSKVVAAINTYATGGGGTTILNR